MQNYYQCGKGRDLGFNTILNFTSKIRAGMAEQRYLVFIFVNRLPTVLVSSFMHIFGFHINNVLIILSIHFIPDT